MHRRWLLPRLAAHHALRMGVTTARSPSAPSALAGQKSDHPGQPEFQCAAGACPPGSGGVCGGARTVPPPAYGSLRSFSGWMWKLFFQTTGRIGHGWQNTAAVSLPACRYKHMIAAPKTRKAVIRMNIYGIYFSPTGGTEKIVTHLAKEFGIPGMGSEQAGGNCTACIYTGGYLCHRRPLLRRRVPAVALERMASFQGTAPRPYWWYLRQPCL